MIAPPEFAPLAQAMYSALCFNRSSRAVGFQELESLRWLQQTHFGHPSPLHSSPQCKGSWLLVVAGRHTSQPSDLVQETLVLRRLSNQRLKGSCRNGSTTFRMRPRADLHSHNGVKPIINHPFGNASYHLFISIHGDLGDGLWHCFTHITLW